jgi:tetratricopeptide (TPR) repeat protein
VAVVLVGVAAAVPLTRRYVLAPAVDQPVVSVPAPARKYVAVLRFRVIGDQAALAHIAAGIEEALSTKLFQLPVLNVASAAAVERAAGTTEAIAELTVASQMAPRSDEVFRRLGRAYLSTGRGDQAIQAYEKAVAINPYYWVSYSALGVAHMQLGAYAKAAEILGKVIELEPENVSGHNDLGAAYLQVGRYNDSAAAFTRALELQPTAQTYTNLGIAYAYGGKHADAIPMFEKAVELSPSAEQFVGNLGDGYRWGGQAAKATASDDKAIGLALRELRVNPRNAQVRGNLALYYAKKGDHAGAQRLISDARAIDRANVNLIYAEAVVDVLGGRRSDALFSLEEALKAGYPFSAAQSDPDLQPLLPEFGFKQLAAKFRSN